MHIQMRTRFFILVASLGMSIAGCDCPGSATPTTSPTSAVVRMPSKLILVGSGGRRCVQRDFRDVVESVVIRVSIKGGNYRDPVIKRIDEIPANGDIAIDAPADNSSAVSVEYRLKCNVCPCDDPRGKGHFYEAKGWGTTQGLYWMGDTPNFDLCDICD